MALRLRIRIIITTCKDWSDPQSGTIAMLSTSLSRRQQKIWQCDADGDFDCNFVALWMDQKQFSKINALYPSADHCLRLKRLFEPLWSETPSDLLRNFHPMNRITFKPENPRYHCTTYTHSPFLWTWPGYPWYLLGIRKQRVKVGLLDLGDLDGKLLSVGILRRSLRSLRSVRSWKKNGQEGVGGFGRLEGYRPTVSGFPQLAGMLDHPASNATPATVSSFIWASLRSLQERKHIHNGCIYIQTTLSSFLPNRWSWSTTRPPN